MHTIAKYFQAFCYWPIYGLLRIFVHFKIEGQENLRGLEEKGVIFACNHNKTIDPIFAVALPRGKGEFYPKKFFPVRFLAHSRLFKFRYLLIALYVWINGSIPVGGRKNITTDKDLKNILIEPVKALLNGVKLWIFPEGGINRGGPLRKGKRGVAYLHKATGAPIVPVALLGTADLYSPLTFLGLKKVTLRFGKPIYSLGECSLEEGAQKVMAAIAELMK